MTHAELLAEIERACTQRGYWCWTDRQSVRQTAGWVDMVILGHGRAWFLEAKAEDGRRVRAQIAVARLLTAAALEYRCVRPSGLDAFITEISTHWKGTT